MDHYFGVGVTDEGVVALHGELDAGSSSQLTDAIDAVPSDDGAIVLDLEDLTFIDAAGVRSLAGIAAAEPLRLIVARSPHSHVARVCRLMADVLPGNFVITSTDVGVNRDGGGA